MKLKQIVDRINAEAPTVDNLIKVGFDKKSAEDINKDFVLNYLDCNNSDDTDISVDNFFNNIESRRFSCIGFSFREIETYEDYITFGFYAENELALIEKSGEVVILDCYTGDIITYVSKSFEDFLMLLSVLSAYSRVGFLNEVYTDEIKRTTIDKIKNILKKERYYNFFVSMIPIS